MVDKIILELPADTVGGDIVVSTETRERAETAAAASEAARDQAQVYAANTVELQDTTFTALIADEDSATRTQLNATIAVASGAVTAPAPSGVDDTVALQALIDSGASVIRLKSFGTYNIGNLSAPARDLSFEGVGSVINATTASPVITKNGGFSVGLFGVRVNLLSEGNKVTDAPTGTQFIFGRLDARNDRDATAGVENLANFAAQGVASNVIGWAHHNYTDSTAHQFDNVGSGANLILKNAHNPVRRGDKPADYVGDGIFLKLETHDFASAINRSLFFIDKDGRFTWSGATRLAATGGAALFLSNKPDDGLPAYRFELTNKHAVIARFGDALDIGSDVGFTRASFKTPAAMTSGLILDTTAGDTFIQAAGGSAKVQLSGRVRFRGAANFQASAGPVIKYLLVSDDSNSNFAIPLHAIA